MVGLKLSILISEQNIYILLESDHGGIEIYQKNRRKNLSEKLESDHGGIEIV